MDILPLDAGTSPTLLRSWHALQTATDLELEPHVPPAPLDEALPSALSDDLMQRQGWLLADTGAVIGSAIVELPLLENTHLAMLDVRIDPGRRRAGLGSMLTALGAQAAHRAGRPSLIVEATAGSAGSAACAALGAERALDSTSSTLRIADLDRNKVQAWIARRGERAVEYSLVRWIDQCPEELVDSCASLREAMNTAPLGELDLTIEYTPEILRATERVARRAHRKNFVVCARHDPSGELVGLTDVIVPIGRPTLGMQEDTVVRPDHRDRGLGRWIKAEMLAWLADEAPTLEQIVTWNATENAPMRAINTELGFVPGETWTEWQFNVAALVERTRSLAA
jgi:GNAT superfamily N-acetyltransferase